MNTTTRIALTLALTALCASVDGAAKSDHAAALLAAAKRAMGGAAWDKVVTWHESGRISAGGLDGTYEAWVDLRTLQNSDSYVLGPVSGSAGWDGDRAWSTDNTKEVRIESSGEAVAQAIQDAYRGAFAFLFPQRYAAGFEDAGTRQADGVAYAAVKVTPKGAEPFEIWFDPSTHFIAREVQLTGAQPHTFILSKFTRVDGILAPEQTIDRVGNDPKYDTVTATKAIELTGPQPASRYAPPPPPPNSAEWPAGRDSVSIPFRLLNNHIYVDASIDGAPPTPFLFDTGATDILDAGAAQRLGLTIEGALPGGGFGDKIPAFGFAKVKRVSLGGLTLPDQVFGTTDLSGLIGIEGTDSAGLLGYEFVKRAVLSIDYAKRTMTFIRQDAFRPPAGATAIPFTFAGHIPMVAGTIDGFSGEFEIDTGSRGALTVMAPFAAAHDLIGRYHADHSATVGYGVGGPSRALLARAERLSLGGVSVDAPVTEIVTDKGGAAEAARTAGNIGGDILKRFTLTLDYAHQTLWLEPNALANQREVFDRSGLWIARAKDGAIAVGDVVAGSAAARAGLAVGDEITAVNGKSAADVALYDLREEFKGAAGTRFTLRIRTKQGDSSVILTLADQI
jgi:membrane-associated protease RseP (regulator of RpoE activity)